MEIPNYDSDTKNKKFKQRYLFMPNDTFRMLIEPLLYYDEIHL